MGKRVCISNDSLNSYGTRVLTAGMDVEQYKKNPVLLWMHWRGNVIGYMKDIRVEDGEVTGEPVFDEVTELSKTVKSQFEFGSVRMVSVGIDILELSSDPSVLVEGQTAPTVTRSRLFEVSIVDIGSNDDAIVLRRDGKTINLGMGGENCLPLLNNQNTQEMEITKLALKLGLPATAGEAEVTAAIDALLAAKAENETLLKERKALELEKINAAVAKAIDEKKLDAGRKDQFVKLGLQVGLESLCATLEAMAPRVKISEVLGSSAGTGAYTRLSEVPEAERMALRKSDIELYKKLYSAEYGIECEL